MRNLELDVSPITYLKLVNTYSGGKRRMYLRAYEKVLAEGWRKEWAYVKMFVKPDKYPEGAIREKAPRAIQYRSPMFNLMVGRYLHAYEHKLMQYEDTGPTSTTFFAKGLNQQQRAEILMRKISAFKSPLFICLDHSKFDSTIDVELLKLEHLIYYRTFRSKRLRWLLRHQLANKGLTKSGIKYFVKGTRMSGDYNTGLGNSLVNYLCLRSWLDGSGVVGEILLDGDDSIVIIEADMRERLNEEHFSRFGFTTKIGYTTRVCEVEFCQSRLLPSGPVMARNPFRALSHLAVSVKTFPPKVWPRIQQARGMCEFVGSSGVPILQAFGERMMTGVKPLFLGDDLEKWKLARTSERRSVTDEVRLEFYDAWGLDPYTQELIEESFSDPHLLSVGNLSKNSDIYNDESLQAAAERWASLATNSGECSWASGEGGMAIL